MTATAVSLDEYRQPLDDMVATRDRNGDGVLSQDDRRMRLRHRDGPGMMDMDNDGPDSDEPPQGKPEP